MDENEEVKLMFAARNVMDDLTIMLESCQDEQDRAAIQRSLEIATNTWETLGKKHIKNF